MTDLIGKDIKVSLQLYPMFKTAEEGVYLKEIHNIFLQISTSVIYFTYIYNTYSLKNNSLKRCRLNF